MERSSHAPRPLPLLVRHPHLHLHLLPYTCRYPFPPRLPVAVPAEHTMCVVGLPAGVAMTRVHLCHNAGPSVARIQVMPVVREATPAAALLAEAAAAAAAPST